MPAITLPKQRIQSIDILRGVIMLIMALDHVRDYFHYAAFTDSPTNLTTTTPFLFFTRFITHFCAPTFLFLSGTSAFLAGQRRTKKELSAFLIKRGFWLVLVELTIITLGWTFNPFYNVIILQVIWAIGWSMIVLGVLVSTSVNIIIILGCIIVFGHNLLDYAHLPEKGTESVILNFLITSPFIRYNLNATHHISDAYAILPWTGLMLLGYGFGQLYITGYEAVKRRKTLLTFGCTSLALFILLRLVNKYGDPAPWSHQKDAVFTFLSFINVTKYPPSLDYCLITLGTSLIAIALLERVQNKLTDIFTTYGRVPFFYYVCHLYLIHFICVVFFFASGHGWKEAIDQNVIFAFRPKEYGFPLVIIYAVWLAVIVLLYQPCKWFDNYRKTHSQWWLSYI